MQNIRVSSDFAQLFLRNLGWAAEEQGFTLWDVLKCASRCQIKTSSTGSILVGTIAHGHGVTFKVPTAAEGYTQTLITELCNDLIKRYDRAKAALGQQTPPITAPTDPQILTEMLYWMEPTDEVYQDWTELRGVC